MSHEHVHPLFRDILDTIAPPEFRRDTSLQPPAGMIIAEFTSGQDALSFARSKGPLYTVTPGINHVYAVRVRESAADPLSPDSALRGSDPSTPEPRFRRAHLPHGRDVL